MMRILWVATALVGDGVGGDETGQGVDMAVGIVANQIALGEPVDGFYAQCVGQRGDRALAVEIRIAPANAGVAPLASKRAPVRGGRCGPQLQRACAA